MKKVLEGILPNGYYHVVDNRIAIKPDMPSAQTFKTLIHEKAHSILHADNGEEVLIHNKKLDALEDLIEAANGRPVMVAYWYKHDLVRIEKRLNEMKIYYENSNI